MRRHLERAVPGRSVSSRPLSLDEIRDRGIIIDESSFTAYEFTFGIGTESQGSAAVPPTCSTPPTAVATSLPGQDADGELVVEAPAEETHRLQVSINAGAAPRGDLRRVDGQGLAASTRSRRAARLRPQRRAGCRRSAGLSHRAVGSAALAAVPVDSLLADEGRRFVVKPLAERETPGTGLIYAVVCTYARVQMRSRDNRTVVPHRSRERAAREIAAIVDSELFRALCEPVRIEIVKLLTARGRSDVQSIAAQVPQDRSVALAIDSASPWVNDT